MSTILYLDKKVSPVQLQQMLEALTSYVKLAVDIEKGVAVGGGELHADCEDLLYERGSQRKNIWGADWIPDSQQVTYEALINIRAEDNPSMEILDQRVREKVEQIVRALFEGVRI